MSFSFNVRAANATAAKEAVSTKLDEVVAGQPIHEADRVAAQSAAEAYIDLLAENDAKEISVTVNGYVQGDFTTPAFTGVCVGVTAGLVDPE